MMQKKSAHFRPKQRDKATCTRIVASRLSLICPNVVRACKQGHGVNTRRRGRLQAIIRFSQHNSLHNAGEATQTWCARHCACMARDVRNARVKRACFCHRRTCTAVMRGLRGGHGVLSGIAVQVIQLLSNIWL